jgi:hypothetical protein
MVGGREQASFQSDFYRINYHKMLNAVIITSFIILLLIGTIIYLILFRAEPNYFATTTNGLIIPMQPIAH